MREGRGDLREGRGDMRDGRGEMRDGRHTGGQGRDMQEGMGQTYGREEETQNQEE